MPAPKSFRRAGRVTLFSEVQFKNTVLPKVRLELPFAKVTDARFLQPSKAL